MGMVAWQILSKVLETKDISIIEQNDLTVDYFNEFEPEYNFIIGHYKQYGNVPDKQTFQFKFPDDEILEVTETDRYLIDTLREEYLYFKSTPVAQKYAELLKTDANQASAYLASMLPSLQPNYGVTGVDIVATARKRYEEYQKRKNNQEDFFFTCGLEELDELIHGIQKKEELIVLVARTNEGKSWILEKMCTHVWNLGFNVGYISPEMGDMSIGYRFDTLQRNFSNKELMWGKGSDIDDNAYLQYIEELEKRENHFVIAQPKDFKGAGGVTVSKIRNWVTSNHISLVGIDGIVYLSDERAHKGDTLALALQHISEDLMTLSVELEVPVVVVVQANRGAINKEDENAMPELENIKDSDGISHSASKVISLRQTKERVLKLQVKKQRFGGVGGMLSYKWDINTGTFTFIPSYGDAQPAERTAKKIKKQQENVEDVF